MKRGFYVLALAVVSVGFAVPPSQAEGSSRSAESGVGNNGQRVDAWSAVATSTGVLGAGLCHVFSIAQESWLSLCNDDDGCTVRVTSDATLLRASSGPHVLVTDAAGSKWSVGTTSTTNTVGTNGDSTSTRIAGAATSASNGGGWQCQLYDDSASTTTLDLELYVCHNDLPRQGSAMSCTVRFDD